MSDDVLSRLSCSRVPVDRTVQYADGDDCVYDVRDAIGAPRGVTLVVVHGGFWRPSTDRQHTAAQSLAYAQAGYDVLVPEYPRSPGGWQAMSIALLTLLENIAKPVVLVGHSAGGQLAVWLAQQRPTQVLAAVSLAGCVDLHRVDELALGSGAARAMFGDLEIHSEVWRSADPALGVRAMSPIALVHGSADGTVPVDVSRSFQRRHPEATLTTLAGADHFDLIDPESPFFPLALDVIGSVRPTWSDR